MMKNIVENCKKITLLLFTTTFSVMYGQKDFFTTVGASKRKLVSEKLSYSITADWKHIYNDVAWDRLGTGLEVDYQQNFWTLEAGGVVQYTFDKQISNYFELRPWFGVRLENQIIPDLSLVQEGKVEWRNFIFRNAQDDNYIRTTFEMSFNYNLDKIGLNNWLVNSGYVWYFLKDPALGERFANSKEFMFNLRKKGKNSFLIGYKFETFSKFLEEGDARAHSIELKVFF